MPNAHLLQIPKSIVNQYSPPPPLKFNHTPTLCVQNLGAIIIIIFNDLKSL